MQDNGQNEIETAQGINPQAGIVLKGWASVLNTHSFKESNSSSPKRSHKYFRVSAVQKLSIVSILCMGSLLASCMEYHFLLCFLGNCKYRSHCTTIYITTECCLSRSQQEMSKLFLPQLNSEQITMVRLLALRPAIVFTLSKQVGRRNRRLSIRYRWQNGGKSPEQKNMLLPAYDCISGMLETQPSPSRGIQGFL